LITILAETIGWWLVSIAGVRNNNWVYNILLLFNGSFILWILTYPEPLIKVRKKLLKGVAAFIIFGLCNILFLEGFWKYNVYTEMLLDLMTSVYVCYFFYRVIAEEAYRNLFRYEYFWIAVGFLFSSLGSSVLYIFINSLTAYYKQTHIHIYGYINYGLNIVLYGSLIISFVCRNRNTRSLQASS
jgi:hypothetical protein